MARFALIVMLSLASSASADTEPKKPVPPALFENDHSSPSAQLYWSRKGSEALQYLSHRPLTLLEHGMVQMESYLSGTVAGVVGIRVPNDGGKIRVSALLSDRSPTIAEARDKCKAAVIAIRKQFLPLGDENGLISPLLGAVFEQRMVSESTKRPERLEDAVAHIVEIRGTVLVDEPGFVALRCTGWLRSRGISVEEVAKADQGRFMMDQ